MLQFSNSQLNLIIFYQTKIYQSSTKLLILFFNKIKFNYNLNLAIA